MSQAFVPPILRQRINPEHANHVASVLGSLQQGDIPPADHNYLFLCFTNRCGSNFLAALLAQGGALNEAGEYFNADTILQHALPLPHPSLRAYFARLPALAGATSWLAAKASIDQLMMLTDAGILGTILQRSRFLLMERADRLGQAISRVIASQNNQWTSEQDIRIPAGQLIYSRFAIETELAKIELANAAFYAFFAANALVPLHLTYEALLADPAAEVAGISAWLGVPLPAPDIGAVRLRRQAGPVNEAWRARFLEGR